MENTIIKTYGKTINDAINTINRLKKDPIKKTITIVLFNPHAKDYRDIYKHRVNKKDITSVYYDDFFKCIMLERKYHKKNLMFIDIDRLINIY